MNHKTNAENEQRNIHERHLVFYLKMIHVCIVRAEKDPQARLGNRFIQQAIQKGFGFANVV